MSNEVDYGPVIADIEAKIESLQSTLAGFKAARDMAVSGSAHPPSHRHQSPTVIRVDTFFGKTVIDAILTYLTMVNKQPKTVKEIVDALGQGGCRTSATTASTLLSRRYLKEGDIVRVTKNTWGLASWYGNSIRKPKAKNGDKPAAETEEKS